jgi:hypothetical protein
MEKEILRELILKAFIAFFLIFLFVWFASSSWMELKKDEKNRIEDQQLMTLDQYCLKYYDEYRLSNLPAKCIKTFSK